MASLGREQTFLDRYDNELIAGEQGMRLKSRLRGLIFGLGQTAPFLGYGLSLWYGGVLVADEGMPYQDVIKVSCLACKHLCFLFTSVIICLSAV